MVPGTDIGPTTDISLAVSRTTHRWPGNTHLSYGSDILEWVSYTDHTRIVHMGLFAELNSRIAYLQEGLQPAHLRYWHDLVISDAQAMAPPHLQDKITITQNEHLPMKFHLDISRRVVTYYVMAVENHLHKMPMSTQLYFMQLCEMVGAKMDQQLV